MRKKTFWIFAVLSMMMSACTRNMQNDKKPSPTTSVNVNLTVTSNPDDTPTPKATGKPLEESDNTVTPVTEIVSGNEVVLGNSQANLIALGYVCEHEGKIYYKDINHEEGLCVLNSDGTFNA